MAEDKRFKKYFETMPYGDSALSSEIHGKHNQVVINKFVSSLTRNYDKAIEGGDKELAGHYFSMIRKVQMQLDNLKDIKKEFAVNYGGGVGGKNMFSNYTDLSWDKEFFIENGHISFDKSMDLVLTVMKENKPVSKKVNDITQDWVVRGSEEADFMRLQQEAVKQRNSQGKGLNYDIDWEVSKLCESSWKILCTDKIGGRHFLQDWLIENAEAINNGEIPDEKLHPDSFDPEYDTRLHKYYANRLRKAFNPNYQTQEEVAETDKLMSRLDTEDNQNSQA
tara:strand:- start:232 stop:1068 length:837 start_codon:yes stop_codon:yes gene_type:complete